MDDRPPYPHQEPNSMMGQFREERDKRLEQASLNMTAPRGMEEAWSSLDDEIAMVADLLRLLRNKLEPVLDLANPVDCLEPLVGRNSASTFQQGLWEKTAKVRTLRSELGQILEQLDL